MTHDSSMLATHVGVFKQVRDRIAAEFGLDDDDAAVLDTAEGETDLPEYLARLLREAEDREALAAGLGPLIKKKQERKARLEHGAERLRVIVHNAMTDAGLPRLTAPDFTATRGRGRAPLVIPDEAAVPDDFCKIDRSPKRKDIADALRNGTALNFAFFGNAPEILSIRGL